MTFYKEQIARIRRNGLLPKENTPTNNNLINNNNKNLNKKNNVKTISKKSNKTP